jgi:hypothetical protein
MEDIQKNTEFWYNFNKILTQSLVPHFSNEMVRPCIEEDFEDFRNTIIDNLNYIALLLDLIIQKKIQYTKSITENLFKVVIIIGEQHQKSPWNTDRIMKLSELLIKKICKIFGHKNITEILKDDAIFIMILKFLRPKLLKSTWKCFPAAVNCYKWLLETVKKPFLKKYISDIIPTALIILDDYNNKNQMLGINCISIIIEHCQKSRILKIFNYDEVIFQALKRMSYEAESFIIISLYSCISSLLINIDHYENKNHAFRWNKRDEILAILLDNMELQINLQYRYDYIMCLSKFITYINSGKWSIRLTRILSEYCENDTDLNTTDATLDFIKTFLLIYQPQGLNFYIIIYSSLLKLRYNIILFEKPAKKIIHKIDECTSFIVTLCPYINRKIITNKK